MVGAVRAEQLDGIPVWQLQFAREDEPAVFVFEAEDVGAVRFHVMLLIRRICFRGMVLNFDSSCKDFHLAGGSKSEQMW